MPEAHPLREADKSILCIQLRRVKLVAQQGLELKGQASTGPWGIRGFARTAPPRTRGRWKCRPWRSPPGLTPLLRCQSRGGASCRRPTCRPRPCPRRSRWRRRWWRTGPRPVTRRKEIEMEVCCETRDNGQKIETISIEVIKSRKTRQRQ